MEVIEAIETRRDLTDVERFSCQLLRATILIRRNQINDALLLAEKTLYKSQDLGQHLVAIDALIVMATALYELGRYDEGLEVITQGEQLLANLEKPASTTPRVRKVIQKLISKITGRAIVTPHPPIPHSVIASASSASDTDQLSAIMQRKAAILFRKATLLIAQGHINQAQDLTQQSLELYQTLGNRARIGSALLILGSISSRKGDFDKALDYYQQSLTLYEEQGIRYYTFSSINNIGEIYRQKGELELALEYYQKGLALATDIGNRTYVSTALINIGATYWQKGDLERAQEYLERGLKLLEKEQAGTIGVTECLTRLIFIAVEQNNQERAQHYLNRIKEIHDSVENKLLSQIYRLAKAIVLKASPRARYRVQAEELFMQLVDEEIIVLELTTFALLYLCDLQLAELRNTGDSSLLEEIQSHVNRLLEIAQKQGSQWVLTETYTLQGRLALLQLDLNAARRMFTQAQTIAEEHGLQRLATIISREHDILLDQLGKWEELIERQAPLAERVELAQLEKLVVRMVRKRVEEIPELPEEEPVLLLILAGSGISLFSKSLMPESALDTQLVSGFLTAIHGFSGEVFSQSLDRAKLGDFTLLMQAANPLLVSYVCKGQSYSAQRKLTTFLSRIQADEEIWQKLVEAQQMGKILTGEDYKAVEDLLIGIFPS